MLGVGVNIGAIIVGSLLGLLLKKVLKENITNVLMQAIGISVLAIGIMDAIKTPNVLILILSLAIGGLLGSLLRIQSNVEKFGAFVEKKLTRNGEGGTVGKAFVNSTLIFCVGAMVIYGSIQSGLGQPNTLYIKALLDGTIAMIMATTLGWGVILSVIPVGIIQSTIALLAHLIVPYVTQPFLNQLSGIGGVLVMCIGLNLLNVTKIRTADLVPAIFGSLVILWL